jgi:hypothetical protein
VYYLHNNPSPPLGDTNAQPVLPCDGLLPLAPLLFNYDADNNTDAGRTIQRGGSGAGETDTGRHQSWRTAPLGSNLDLGSTIDVQFWVAIKDMQVDKVGVIRIYIQDVFGLSTSLINEGVTVLAPTTADWYFRGVSINTGSYVIPAGHQLEVKVTVDNISDDDVWFAYDTLSYPSRIVGY